MSTFKVDILQSRSGGATTFTGQWAAKAFVSFDSAVTTINLKGSGNIGSITDNGVGDFTMNFTNALTSANYAPLFTTRNGSIGGIYQTSLATTSFRLIASNIAGTSTDSSDNGVVVLSS